MIHNNLRDRLQKVWKIVYGICLLFNLCQSIDDVIIIKNKIDKKGCRCYLDKMVVEVTPWVDFGVHWLLLRALYQSDLCVNNFIFPLQSFFCRLFDSIWEHAERETIQKNVVNSQVLISIINPMVHDTFLRKTEIFHAFFLWWKIKMRLVAWNLRLRHFCSFLSILFLEFFHLSQPMSFLGNNGLGMRLLYQRCLYTDAHTNPFRHHVYGRLDMVFFKVKSNLVLMKLVILGKCTLPLHSRKWKVKNDSLKALEVSNPCLFNRKLQLFRIILW